MPPQRERERQFGQRSERRDERRGFNSREDGNRGAGLARKKSLPLSSGSFRKPGRGGVDEREEQRLQNIPLTNESLMRQAAAYTEMPHADQIALTASEIVYKGNTVSIGIDKEEQPVRDDRLDSSELPSRSELGLQAYVMEREGHSAIVKGSFPIGVSATLLLPTENGQYEAIAFRQAESPLVRGEAGATGAAQMLPGREAVSEIGEEHYIIGQHRQTRQEVILAIKTDEPESRQIGRVLRSNERALQGLRVSLEAALKTKGYRDNDVIKLTQRINYLQENRPIVFAEPEKLPIALDQSLQRVTASLNGQEETFRGLVRFDDRTKSVHVSRPVAINPAKVGIRIKEIIDASGLNRQQRRVSAVEKSLALDMQEWMRSLAGPEKVQDKTGEVTPPALLEARQYRYHYEVPKITL